MQVAQHWAILRWRNPTPTTLRRFQMHGFLKVALLYSHRKHPPQSLQLPQLGVTTHVSTLFPPPPFKSKLRAIQLSPYTRPWRNWIAHRSSEPRVEGSNPSGRTRLILRALV